MSPSPALQHQELLSQVVHELRLRGETFSKPTFIGQAPIEVRFGAGRILYATSRVRKL